MRATGGVPKTVLAAVLHDRRDCARRLAKESLLEREPGGRVEERPGLGEDPRVLDGIAKSLSPLDEAMEIGKRVAKVGFEWPDMEGVLDKVKEEIAELQAESEPERVESEFGDVLFSLIQWARKKGVDPDRALRRQLQRFRGRFHHVEDFALENGGWEQQDLEHLEAAWQAAKKK